MDTISEILDSWNMPQLIMAFQENDIDMEAFNELTDDAIKELIPKIGPRMLFLKKYREHKWAKLRPLEEDTSTDAGSLASSNCDSLLSPANSDIEDLSSSCNPWPGAILGLNIEEVQNSPVGRTRKEAIDKAEKETNLKNDLSKFQKGKAILCFYEKNKTLTDDMRDKLTEIIIENEIADDVDKRISVERFHLLANAVVSIFPSEIKELYFSVAYKKKISGSFNKVGCGKLFRKYYNVRRKMRDSGLLAPIKHEVNQSNPDSHVNCSESELDKENVNWLRNSIEPWTSVIDRWEKTYLPRSLWRSKPINEYFNAFPALKLNLGYTLLQKDFHIKFPQLETKLFSNFTEFSKNILKYAKSLNNSAVHDYLKTFESHLDEDSYSCHVLFLLPMLMKSVVVIKQKNKDTKENKFWKPSTMEISEGFILHVKIVAEIKPALERKRNKLASYGLTQQPTPVFVGPSLETIKAFYVSIDDVLYEVPTPLKAVDVTFGLLHALNAEYPKEAEQVWLLIQKSLYGLETKYDSKYLAVETIINTIRKY